MAFRLDKCFLKSIAGDLSRWGYTVKGLTVACFECQVNGNFFQLVSPTAQIRLPGLREDIISAFFKRLMMQHRVLAGDRGILFEYA